MLSGLFVAPVSVAATEADRERISTASTSDVHFDIQADYGGLDGRTIFLRASEYFGWCLAFFGAAALVGLLPAMFLFLIGFIRAVGRESWRMAFAIATPMWLFCYLLFHHILIVPWPQTIVGDFFPGLRSSVWFNLF